MADDLVDKAMALKSAIEAEIIVLNQHISATMQRLSELESRRSAVSDMIVSWVGRAPDAGQASESAAADSGTPGAESPPKTRSTGNSTKEEVADETRRLIEERGAPYPRQELLKTLNASGFTIEGSNPLTVLSTMLWRARDHAGLFHLRGHGYWLVERPYAPAGYDPSLPRPSPEGRADGNE